MKSFTKLLIFTTGAVVGSVVVWKYTKDKYEKIVQEEIDSVKSVFKEKIKKMDDVNIELLRQVIETEFKDLENTDNEIKVSEEKSLSTDKKKDENDSYDSKLKGHGYVNYSDVKDIYKPYVIRPEEFGEIEEYECISLTYYHDKVLADGDDVMIKDVEDLIGSESLSHFGKYEDDSVFVRNDRLKCDFEILLDIRNYSEIIKGWGL